MTAQDIVIRPIITEKKRKRLWLEEVHLSGCEKRKQN